MNTDTLYQSVNQLFSLLETRKIDFVLVGGIALLQYVEGRNTEDIDLIMAVSSLKKVPEIEITDQNQHFARGTFNNLQIDLLLTANPLFARVQQRHTHVQEFIEKEIPTATIDGLLLLKLYALPSLYRQGNFAKAGVYENDVATLMYYHQPNMQGVLEELNPFVEAGDFTEITGIVEEIEKRLSRFGRSSS